MKDSKEKDRRKLDWGAWWQRNKSRSYETDNSMVYTAGWIISTSLFLPPSCSNLSIVCHYGAPWKQRCRGGGLKEIPSLSLSPAKLIIWSSLSLSVCFILLFAPLLRFISEYFLILLFPWLYAWVIQVYAAVCVCVCVCVCESVCIQSKLDRLHTKLSMRSFLLVRDCRV